MVFKSFDLSVKDKIKNFSKVIVPDSDKSISIRSFLLNSIALDKAILRNVLESDDVISTIKCLKQLGVKIKKIKNGKYIVFGRGLGSFYCKKGTNLNFGNSGTLARLIIGILSTTPNINVKITGDKSLNKRNMRKLISEMEKFGANFFTLKKNYLPLNLVSSEIPIGIDFKAGVSAQIKSAVILAGLNSYGETNITELKKSRDHTENILINNPNILKIKKGKYNSIRIFGKKSFRKVDISVPGDPSNAAFFTTLTLLSKNSKLIIKKVCLNSRRIGFYEILKKNGAKIKFINRKKINNEYVADIQVKSSNIKSFNAGPELYSKATDEYPILFIIAALINGKSTFNGIGELANKESNRITEMKKILLQAKIKCKSAQSKMTIYGKKNKSFNNLKIKVPSLGDHRICMSATIFSLLTGIPADIKNFETVGTSSPSFLKIIKKLGAKFEIKKKL